MIEQVRPAALQAWMQSMHKASPDRSPLVLDVREGWELQTASVTPSGFTLVHIPMGEIASRVSELKPGTPIACLCHHGARSQRVAQFLHQQGLGPVVNIAGGIDAWSGEVDPSVPRY